MTAIFRTGLLLAVLMPVAGCILSRLAFGPSIEITPVTASDAPDTLERGRYLSHHVSACISCHSKRDFGLYSAPLKVGSEGAGGERYDEEIGFPGTVITPNLTPHRLGSWSDGEIFRAITSGVSKDGSALFPIMPYLQYGKMAKSDVRAVIQYLRTLPTIVTMAPPRELNLPLNFIVNTMPAPFEGPERPPAPGTIAAGAYLAEMGACLGCHSQDERGQPIEGKEWSGGRAFVVPGFGTVQSANITPHKVTGIGAWTRDVFVTRFKAMQAEGAAVPVSKGDLQTVMPWTDYAGMTESDLGAIYDFLRTVPVVDNFVERFSAVTSEPTP